MKVMIAKIEIEQMKISPSFVSVVPTRYACIRQRNIENVHRITENG